MTIFRSFIHCLFQFCSVVYALLQEGQYQKNGTNTGKGYIRFMSGDYDTTYHDILHKVYHRPWNWAERGALLSSLTKFSMIMIFFKVFQKKECPQFQDTHNRMERATGNQVWLLVTRGTYRKWPKLSVLNVFISDMLWSIYLNFEYYIMY